MRAVPTRQMVVMLFEFHDFERGLYGPRLPGFSGGAGSNTQHRLE